MSNGLWDRPGTAQVRAMPGAGAGTIAQGRVDEGLRAHMLRVYNYLTAGLAVSGFVAYALKLVPALGSLFFVYGPNGQLVGTTALGMIAMFAPLVMMFGAMFMMNRLMNPGAIQGFFWAFVGLKGIGLSIAVQTYAGADVAQAFLITAAAFAGLSLWGYTTKRDLSGMGSFLLVGLIGLVIASVVNIFIGSSMLNFIVSVGLLLVMGGLIAFDTQRIKEEYREGFLSDGEGTVHAVWSALNLYISVITIFQILLSFIGGGQDE